MNPKSMLRRTLALLLVLIFVLSNMGLAEMAEAVADSIPAAESQIEEIAEEAAPVEEQAEEAAPAEEEPAPAEDEADAAEAPAEETEAPADEAAPAEDEPVVQVALTALDEQSLFADAEGTVYDGELAYQWEIASTDENGETVWNAIEGATDAIYAGDVEEMAGQTYRCVVTAGDVSVASEGIVSDPAIFGVEVAALGLEESIELAGLNDESKPAFTLKTSGGADLTTLYSGFPGVDEGGEYELQITDYTSVEGTQYDWEEIDENGDVVEDKYNQWFECEESENGAYTLTVGKTELGTGTENVTSYKGSHRIVGIRLKKTENEVSTVSDVLTVQVVKQLDANALLKVAKAAIVTVGNTVLDDGATGTYSFPKNDGDTVFKVEFPETGNGIPDGGISALGYVYSTFTDKPWNEKQQLPGEGAAVTVGNGQAQDQNGWKANTGVHRLIRKTGETTDYGIWNLKHVDGTRGDIPHPVKWEIGLIFWDQTVNKPFPKNSAMNKFIAVVPYPVDITLVDSADAEEHAEVEGITLAKDATQGSKKFKIYLGELPAYRETTVKWTVKGNSWGAHEGENTFVEFDGLTAVDGATGEYTSQHGGTSSKDPEITISVSDDVGSGTGDKPVEITISADVFDESKGAVVTATKTLKINVLPEAKSSLTNNDIKIVPAMEGQTVLGQPAATSADGKTPDWATAQATVTNTALQGYDVIWAAGDGKSGSDATTDAAKYIKVAANGKITVLAKGEGNEIIEANGHEVLVSAILKKDTGEEGAPNDGKAYATAKITILPQQKTMKIGEVTGSGANSKYVDGGMLLDEETNIKAKNVISSASGLKLKAELPTVAATGDVAVKPFGKIESATITLIPDDPDAATQDPISVTIDQYGNMTVPISTVGHYEFEVTPTIKTDKYTLHLYVLKTPEKFSLTSADDREDVHASDGLILTAVIADKDNNPAYMDKINWVVAGTGLDTSTTVVSGLLTTAPTQNQDTSIYVMKPDADDADADAIAAAKDAALKAAGLEKATPTEQEAYLKKVVFAKLVIGANVAMPTGTTVPKITVTVRHDTSAINRAQKTFNLKATPEFDLDNALKLDRAAEDGANVKIGQGETSVKAYIDTADNADLAAGLKNYTLVYSVDKAADEKTELGEGLTVDDYVTINSETGALNVKPLNEKKTNKIEATGLKFTVTAKIAGWDTKTDTVDFEILPAPEKVEIMMVTGKNGDTMQKAPRSITVNNPISLIAVLEDADGKAETVAGAVPGLKLKTASSAYTLKQDTDADGKTKKDSWTLTSKVTSSTVVTVETEAYNGVKGSLDIMLSAEKGITTEDGKNECPYNGTKGHIWVLSDEPAGPDGHYYVCIAKSDEGQQCTAKSKAIPHSGWTAEINLKHEPLKDGEKQYTEDDVKWVTDGVNDAGAIQCAFCDFKCPHTNFPVAGTAKYVNSEYHTGTCPLCGETLKQAHDNADKTNICSVCDGASAAPEFLDAETAVAVVNGGTYTPQLTVPGTDTWTAEYSVDAADEQYIQIVDATTGEMKALKAKADGKPVTVHAKIEVATNDFKATVEKDLEVSIKELITKIQITSDIVDSNGKAYIVENDDDAKPMYLHLTAAAPEQTAPDWRGYEWKLATGEDEEDQGVKAADYVELVTLDKDGTEADVAAVDKQEIWIAVADSITGSTAADKPALVKYVCDTTELATAAPQVKVDAEVPFAKGVIGIDVLKKLVPGDIDDLLAVGNKNADATTEISIMQGDSQQLSLTKWETNDKDEIKATSVFDERYGKVTFEVSDPEQDPATKLSKGDVAKWIGVGADNVLTAVKAGANTLNKLTSANPTKTFTVNAKVTLNQTPTVETQKEVTVSSSRAITVKIISAPASAKFQYKDESDTTITDETKKWKDIPATGLNMIAGGKELEMRVVVVAPKDGSKEMTTIKPEDVEITWPTDKKFEHSSVDSDGTFTVSALSGASGSFTIAAKCFGVEIPDVTLNVQQMISNIVLKPSVTAIGAGETYVDADNITRAKQVEIEVTIIPAEAADVIDETNWTFTAGEDENRVLGITVKPVEGSKNKYAFAVPATINDTDETAKLTIEVSAKNSKKINAETSELETVKGSCTMKLFKRPTEADALQFGLKKEQIGGKNVLTVGERTYIDPACYNADAGYGASAEETAKLVPVYKEGTLADADADSGKDVLKVEKDVDGKWYVEGVAEGTGIIALRPYTYDAKQKTGPEATLSIDVTAGIDGIDVVESKLEAPYTIGIGYPEPTTIAKDAFTAYRNNEPGAEPEKITATDAAIELKADDPSILDIEKDANGNWVLVGKGTEGGTTKVCACVGETESAKFDVIVKPAPIGVKFYYEDGTPVEGQITPTLAETNEPIILEAKPDPINAFGTVSAPSITAGSSVTVDAAASTGTKIKVTPNAEGTTVISATIYNPKWTEGATDAANHPKELTGNVEIVVLKEGSEVEPPVPPVEGTMEIAGKKAITVGETTQAVLLGIDSTATVVWSIKETSGACATINSDGLVTGVTPGTATVTAMVNGVAFPIEQVVHVLNPIGDVTVDAMRISKNEVVEIKPHYTGYDFPASDAGADVEIDDSGLFSVAYNDTASQSKVKLTAEPNGTYTVTGLAAGEAHLTLTALGGKTAPVNITVVKSANKSFALSIKDTTLYMAPKSTEIFTATYNPTSTVANIAWSIVNDEDRAVVDDDSITIKQNTSKDAKKDNCTITVAETAEPGAYTVTASASGVEQKFGIVVAAPADETTTKKLIYNKIGGNPEAMYTASDVTLYKGEKLQVLVADADTGDILGGKIALTSSKKFVTTAINVLTAKSTGKNASVTVTLDGASVGTLNITAKAAPKSVKVNPNVTSLTVGAEEQFTLQLTSSASDDWFTLVGGDKIGLKPVTGEDDAVVKDTYTCDTIGTETINLVTTWGVSKPVTITVKPKAELESLPETMKLPAGDKLRIKVGMGEATEEGEPYANLNWSVGGTLITKASQTITKNQLTVKKIANNEIELVSTKRLSGDVKVEATAVGYPDMKAETTVKVESYANFEGATITFPKYVIGKSEKIKPVVTLEDVEYDISQSLSWKSSAPKNAKIDSKTGEVTGLKPGTSAVITAVDKATKQQVGEAKTIYVISAAKVIANVWPKTMASGEKLTVLVTIGDYTGSGWPTGEEDPYQILTGDLMTATSSSDVITVESFEPVPSDDEVEGSEHTYALVLKAKEGVTKDAKGKYPKATVAINLSYKKNAKKQSITVVEQPNIVEGIEDGDIEVYFPSDIYISKSEKVSLAPSVGDVKDVAVNFSWSLEPIEDTDAAKAVVAQLSIQDGKLVASKTPVAGKALLKGIAAIGEVEKELKATVTVGDAVKKGQFNVVLPKQTAGLSEHIQALVQYTTVNVVGGGNITWKSSNTKVAAIDKATGLITTKKEGTAKITATIKGKKSAAVTLTVKNNMPIGIKFEKPEQNVKAGELVTVVASLIGYDGVTATEQYAQYESAYTLAVVEGRDLIDMDDPETNIRAGKIKIVGQAPESGKIVIRATTVNGKTAECILSLGKVTGGSGTQPEEPVKKPAEDIELWLNGKRLTQDTLLELQEEDSFQIDAFVKDADGIITEAPVTWGPTDDKRVSVVNGLLTANANTFNEATQNLDPIEITASITKEDKSVVTKSFKISIAPILRQENLKFTIADGQESLIVKDSVKMTFAVTPSSIDSDGIAAEVTSETPEFLTVAPGEDAREWKLDAVSAGTAKLNITVSVAGTTQKFEFTKEINVNRLPVDGEVTISEGLTDGKMTLGAEEVGEFTVKLAESFSGKPSEQQLEPTLWKLASGSTDPVEYKDADITVAHKQKADGEPEPDKFTVVANRVPTTKDTILVKVTAYGTASTTFPLVIKQAPADGDAEDGIEITAVPGLDKNQTSQITLPAGVGETVTLSAKLPEKGYWSKGLEWKLVGDYTDAVPDAVPGFEKLENGDVAVSAKSAMDVRVKAVCVGSDAEEGNDGIGRVVTINFQAKPSYGDGGLEGVDSVAITTDKTISAPDPVDGTTNIYTIGEKEKVTAAITYANGYHANDVTWRSDSKNVSLVGKGTTCEITGVSTTNGGTITVEATIGEGASLVTLGSVKLQIAKAPTAAKFDLVLSPAGSDGKYTAFDFKFDSDSVQTTTKQVTVDMGDASAACTLECDNKWIKIVEAGDKNVWTISWHKQTDEEVEGVAAPVSGTSVTLTLRSADNKLIKKYNMKLVNVPASFT